MNKQINSVKTVLFTGVFRALMLIIGKMFFNSVQKKQKMGLKFNNNTLLKIIKINRNTEFGKQYKFDKMDINSFKKNIPVSDYNSYIPEITRMINGEKNVLCALPIASFATSSGTTGPVKFIPLTIKQQQLVIPYMGMISLFIAVSYFVPDKKLLKGINLMSYASALQETSGGQSMGTATANGMKKMKGIIPYLYISPEIVYTIKNPEAASYLHALFGLKNRNVQSVTAVFCSHIVSWFSEIEKNWDTLISDIKSGTITSRISIPADIRQALESGLAPDPQRASELIASVSAGFEGLAARIWPQMRFIITVAGGGFYVYRSLLQKYTLDIPIYDPVYASSESLIGFGERPLQSGHYTMTVGIAYYEFINFDDSSSENPQVLDMSELKTGCLYELLITNYSGLYRYRIGDVVRVEGFNNQIPIISFNHRIGTVLNISNEKTTEAHTVDSISQLIAKSNIPGIRISDYTTTIDITLSPPCYIFYLELDSVSTVNDYALLWENMETELLDQILRQVNLFYENYRNRNCIGFPKIKFLYPGSFKKFFNILLSQNPGKNPNQVKIPKCLKNPAHIDFMDSCVIR